MKMECRDLGSGFKKFWMEGIRVYAFRIMDLLIGDFEIRDLGLGIQGFGEFWIWG